jgi:hypothetical protein
LSKQILISKSEEENKMTIINRFKKGVDTAAWTYKQGEITRVEKGIFIGVK